MRRAATRPQPALSPARPGLRQLKQQRTREAILAAAERLFLDQGFAGTRIEAICAAAEISLGTFYNFFRSKQEVLIYFLRRDRERVAGRIERALAASTARPAAYLTGLLLADLALDAADFSRDLWREIVAAMMQSAGEPGARAAINAYRQGFRACLGQALDRLAADGRLAGDPPREALGELLYSVTAYQFQEYVAGGIATAPELARRLETLVDLAIAPWLAAPKRPRPSRAG